MTDREFKDLLPNSKLTPQSINDLYFGLTAIRQDTTKLRLVNFGSYRLIGSNLNAGTNQVFVIINAVGNGQLVFDSSTTLNSPKGELTDYVAIDITETTGTAPVTIQYAKFTYN